MQAFFEKTLESVESIRNQMAFVRSLRDLGGPSPTWQSVKKSFWNAATLISPGKVDISMEMDDIELYADSLLSQGFLQPPGKFDTTREIPDDKNPVVFPDVRRIPDPDI